MITACINLLHDVKLSKEISRRFEAKIEESEKTGSCPESNPGHLAYAASSLPLSYYNRSCIGGTEVATPAATQHVLPVRTLLGVDWKILSISPC